MKIAFVFPGQGSQSVGMMNGYANLPIIQNTFEEASDILQQNYWSMVNDGPAEDLNLTIHTQPIMLTAGVAVYRAWKELSGQQPSFLAGHSLGEYTALVASETLSFADALAMVRFRAQSMQQAVPEGTGGMAAILGLDDTVIQDICDDITQQCTNEMLEPANFNSPGQVVIAGHKHAVQQGIELAKSRGAKRAIMLPMSIPSHCSLMQPATETMQHYLEQIPFQPPKITILHNADVKSHPEIAEIKKTLIQQLVKPVRWVDTIRTLAGNGVTHVIECGPGKVLAGLNKRIDSNLQHLSLSDSATTTQAIELFRVGSQ